MTKINKERPVVVTTLHRGIFFGYAVNTDGKTIKLRAARLAVYYPNDTHGFMGLASFGPRKGSRIGPPADIELRDITCIMEVSDEARENWEKGIWD